MSPGSFIAKKLTEKNITLTQFCSDLNLEFNNMFRVVTGVAKPPTSRRLLYKFAEYLDCDIKDLNGKN